MEIKKEKVLPTGKRLVTVMLHEGEELIAVRDDEHYRLGQPVEDIVAGHIITEAQRVVWCSASQRWAEV